MKIQCILYDTEHKAEQFLAKHYPWPVTPIVRSEYNIDINLHMGLNAYKSYFANHILACTPLAFPIHPEQWTDDFLEYDYIGPIMDENQIREHLKGILGCNNQTCGARPYYVLNSTMFLISRRLLDYVRHYPMFICPYHCDHAGLTNHFGLYVTYGQLHAIYRNGFKIAPPEIATRFCVHSDTGVTTDGQILSLVINKRSSLGLSGLAAKEYLNDQISI